MAMGTAINHPESASRQRPSAVAFKWLIRRKIPGPCRNAATRKNTGKRGGHGFLLSIQCYPALFHVLLGATGTLLGEEVACILRDMPGLPRGERSFLPQSLQGVTLVARRAGTKHASAAVKPTIIATPRKVTASSRLTPKRRALQQPRGAQCKQQADGNTGSREGEPCRKTCQIILRGVAPSANSHAEFPVPLADAVGDHGVNTHHRQQQRDAASSASSVETIRCGKSTSPECVLRGIICSSSTAGSSSAVPRGGLRKRLGRSRRSEHTGCRSRSAPPCWSGNNHEAPTAAHRAGCTSSGLRTPPHHRAQLAAGFEPPADLASCPGQILPRDNCSFTIATRGAFAYRRW